MHTLFTSSSQQKNNNSQRLWKGVLQILITTPSLSEKMKSILSSIAKKNRTMMS